MDERASDVAAQALRTLEDVAEAGCVDVERDLVRVRRGTTRLGTKEDEQRLAQPKRLVLPIQLLGAGQIEVEATQTSRIRSPKGDVVDAENSHRSQSRRAAPPDTPRRDPRPHRPEPLVRSSSEPTGGPNMGDRTQRLKGKANEAAGKTKASVGYETRSGKTEAKGAVQATKGKAQQTVGKARSAAKKKTR